MDKIEQAKDREKVSALKKDIILDVTKGGNYAFEIIEGNNSYWAQSLSLLNQAEREIKELISLVSHLQVKYK